MAATRTDFESALRQVFAEAERLGVSFIGLTSKALHQRVGGYPGTDHRMPVCCEAMRNAMGPNDSIVAEPPKRNGASLLIQYAIPRPGSATARPAPVAAREPTKRSSRIHTADNLLGFAATLEGERLRTTERGAAFTVRCLPSGLEVTPASTGKPRTVSRDIVQQVWEEYQRTRSGRPIDYQAITFDASYLLVIIHRYVRQQT